MNCTQCGKLLPEANSPFCPFCGGTQSGDATNPSANQENVGQPVPMQTVGEQLEAAQPAPTGGFPPATAGSGTPFDPTLPQQAEKKRLPAWAIALIAGGIALALAICCCIAMVGFFANEIGEEIERELERIEAELEQGSGIDPIVLPGNDSDDNATADNNGGGEADLTMSQQQAIRAAENYLEWMSFSKEGLIHQLSSEFGDGFPEADARFAVESLDIDWYEQAVKSAESYLEFMSFSRQGLIDQLSSDHGSMFTTEQAEHAADAVGL